LLLLPCLCPSPGLARGLDVAVQAGRVTARLHEAPLEEALRALAEAARAELRGTLPEDRRVSANFADLDIRPALERLLGDLSFALVYDADGQLRAIDLRGGPGARPTDPGDTEEGLDLASWPPNESVGRAAEHVQAFTLSDRPVAVRGLLRRTLGADAVPFRVLAQTAVSHNDPRVRAGAVRTMTRALELERDVRDSLVLLLEGAGDGLVAEYFRRAGGERAAELAVAASLAARSPAVRARLRSVATRLAASGPAG